MGEGADDSTRRERIINIEAKAKDGTTASAIVEKINHWSGDLCSELADSAESEEGIAEGLRVVKAEAVGTAMLLVKLEGPAGASQYDGFLRWLWENGCPKISSESYLQTDADSVWVEYVPRPESKPE